MEIKPGMKIKKFISKKTPASNELMHIIALVEDGKTYVVYKNWSYHKKRFVYHILWVEHFVHWNAAGWLKVAQEPLETKAG